MYNKYNSDATISYGLVASLAPGENEKLLSYKNGELICNIQNAILVDVDSQYVGFDFIIRGFNTEALEKTPLVICAYVVNGTDIFYIGDDTNEAPTPVVMYDIKNSIS